MPLHKVFKHFVMLGLFMLKLKSEGLILASQLIDFPLVLIIPFAELFGVLIFGSLNLIFDFQDDVAPGFLLLV